MDVVSGSMIIITAKSFMMNLLLWRLFAKKEQVYRFFRFAFGFFSEGVEYAGNNWGC